MAKRASKKADPISASSGAATATKQPRKRRAPAKKTQETPVMEIQVVLTHDQIAKRAYDIWVAKGRPVGCQEDDWQEAQQQLHAELMAD